MKIEQHKYGVRSEYIKAGVRVGFVFFLLGSFFMCVGFLSLTDLGGSDYSTFLGSLMYFALLSLLIPFCCVFAYYLYSDIDVDEYGLLIKFFRKPLRVYWADILEVRLVKSKIWPPFVGTVVERKYLVITTSKLSVFHRLYGLIFGWTIASSFLVTSLIGKSPELIEKLLAKSNIQNTVNSTESTPS